MPIVGAYHFMDDSSDDSTIICSCNPFENVDGMPLDMYGEKCLQRNENVRMWFGVFAAGHVVGIIISIAFKYYSN